MRSRWDALHAELARFVHSDRSSRDFAKIRATAPDLLGRFDSPSDLISRLDEGSAASLDEKDDVLACLINRAATSCAGDLAIAIVALALWPGLSTTFIRLTRLFDDSYDELATEIIGQLTESARRFDRRRCSRVAATLVLNTERMVRQARLRELKRGAADEALESQSEVLIDPTAMHSAALVDLRAWLRHAVPDDAELVFSVAVGGRDCGEVALALGLTYTNARQRLARALARVGQRIAKIDVTKPPLSRACTER
jgi:RNA polymerase sigma-70 factor (ECF subfamily)